MLTCSLFRPACGLPAVTVLIWQEGDDGLAYAFPRCEVHKSQLVLPDKVARLQDVRTVQLPVPLPAAVA